MVVTLIQRPTEVAMGRKTVMVDGHQVGYFHGVDRPLLMTRNMEKDEAASIKAEVERIEGVAVGKVAIPPPTPPEWLAAEEVDEDLDDDSE
jgi:hypothetical protein